MSYNISIPLIDQTKLHCVLQAPELIPLSGVPQRKKMQIFGLPIARSEAMPLRA